MKNISLKKTTLFAIIGFTTIILLDIFNLFIDYNTTLKDISGSLKFYFFETILGIFAKVLLIIFFINLFKKQN